MNTKPAFRTEKGKREILDAYQKILRQWPVLIGQNAKIAQFLNYSGK